MHECQEIQRANINQKEDRFLIYERDLLLIYLLCGVIVYLLLRLFFELIKIFLV